MKTILTILLAFVLLGCGEGKMGTIGIEVEVDTSSIVTNVTDDTTEYDTTRITAAAHNNRSSYIIIDEVLWVCGDNTNGQLGVGAYGGNYYSFVSTGVSDVKSVYAGDQIAFIIKKDNSLWVVGSNSNSRFGNGMLSTEKTNVFIDTGITNVKSVAVSSTHTLIVKRDGRVWGCGVNQFGQLGLNTTTFIYKTFQDTGVTGVTNVYAGNSFSYILKEDNSVFSCGDNTYGQLSQGAFGGSYIAFTLVTQTAKALSIGESHALLINLSDIVYSTGQNTAGALGVGDTSNRHTFTVTSPAISAINVSAGNGHSLAVKSTGALFGAGYNTNGQIGLGATPNATSFTDTTVTNVDFSFAGSLFSLIIKDDLSLFATGYNSFGELGLGDTTQRTTFTDTTEATDTHIAENWTYHYQSDIVRVGDYRYSVGLPGDENPSIFTNLTQVGLINELKPFDNQNITSAVFASPMTYTVESLAEFNAFTLAKVLATSVTYTFRNSIGTIVKGPTAVPVDCTRDAEGILSLYPTTVIFYADQQIAAGGTVEVSIANTEGNVQLGDFPLNNTIQVGFSNLNFDHDILDYNDYTPDPFGNIPEATKAIVTIFNGSLDIYLSRYDKSISLFESIAGQNITIDFSDSNGQVADGQSRFASLTRRGRAKFKTKSVVKDGQLFKMANSLLTFTEVV